jgi:transcriptional regulator with XRE-family HTH domain
MTIQKMLKELADLGLSQREIAEACGTSQPNINRALHGTSVRYETGKSIEKLFKKKTKEMRQAV